MDRQQIGRGALEKDTQKGSEHASWISGRIETLLSHYFQPESPTEVKDAALDDWVDALSIFPQPAIEYACRTYLRNQPRRRPTPGDIRAAALNETARSAPMAIEAPEPRRDVVTPEAAARILAAAGFTPEHTQLVKRFPMAASREIAEEKADTHAAKSPHWTETASERELAALKAERDGNALVQEARAAQGMGQV